MVLCREGHRIRTPMPRFDSATFGAPEGGPYRGPISPSYRACAAEPHCRQCCHRPGSDRLSGPRRVPDHLPAGRKRPDGRRPGPVSGLEIDGGVLAAVLLDLIGDLLAFVQAVQASPLDGADMDEHVLAAAVRLNEAKTLGGIKPLDRACRHVRYLLRKSGAELRAVRNPAHRTNEESTPALLPRRISEGLFRFP